MECHITGAQVLLTLYQCQNKKQKERCCLENLLVQTQFLEMYNSFVITLTVLGWNVGCMSY